MKRRMHLVQDRLLAWYARHRRDLPWRRTRDPYRILVSEVMLQQTQVSRVVPKYRAWLRVFPTVGTLAHSPLRPVLRAWSGLGYNRRAVYLRRAARKIVSDGSVVPQSVEQLRELPGVGEYTARAVAAFAYGQSVAVVDTNVARVLGRIAGGVAGPKRSTAVRLLAERLARRRASSVWSQALMDFGAMICTARRPACERCPVRPRCAAYPAILRLALSAKSPVGRFVDSDRFWRGRIVDLVGRSGTLRRSSLGNRLAVDGRLSAVRLKRLLRALQRDGLIDVTASAVKTAA